MRIIEEWQGTMSGQERDELLGGLLDAIEHINERLSFRHSLPEPDSFSIGEFNDLRNRYIEQLAMLLQRYGVDVKPLPVLPSHPQAA
jgi:hypothetical protein